MAAPGLLEEDGLLSAVGDDVAIGVVANVLDGVIVVEVVVAVAVAEVLVAIVVREPSQGS